MSDGERRRSGGENTPLILAEETDPTSTVGVPSEDKEDGRSYLNCSRSQTTVIGLLLLLAMVSLTILSILLQRFSTNTFVDIISPGNTTTDMTDRNETLV